jgi:ribosomal protein S27E
MAKPEREFDICEECDSRQVIWIGCTSRGEDKVECQECGRTMIKTINTGD